jgi:hypothetical protein
MTVNLTVSESILTDTGATPTISWGGTTIDNTLTFTGVGNGRWAIVFDNTYSDSRYIGDFTSDWDFTLNLGRWSWTTPEMSEGKHALIFYQPDKRVDVSFEVVLGTFSSTIATNTGATSTISGGTQITYDHTLGLTGQASTGSTVQIFDGQTALGFATVGADRNWNFTTSALANGTHNFSAHITTADGTVRDYACDTVVKEIDLITNGDFEDGNTGFTTGYTMQSQANGAGTAAVVTTPPAGWGMGASTGFGGSGKFLMVDGSSKSTNTPTVWAERVTGLEANTHYDFSFQMMTNSNHSNLAVKNNGAQVFVTSMNDNQGWTNNTVDLVSDSSGVIDLSLVTVGNFKAAGNDFGLDHLSLNKSAAMLKNWVVNGDFEDGNTGFTTGYTMQAQATAAGTAAVVTAPPEGWGMGAVAGYGGLGKFLMVDGSSNSTNNPTVWAEKITGLEASRDYDFSFWMMTNNNASTLAINSNGSLAGTTALQDGRNWTQVTKTVTSNASGELALSLATTAHYQAFGNDFGLDHISLVRHVVL